MFHITESEYEVMEMVWKHAEGIRQAELLELLHERGKEWKRQTLNTFLSRLEEKGIVKRERRLVTPLYSKEDYHHMQIKETIDKVYNGRLSDLVLAFTGRQEIDEEEAERLLQIIRRKEREEE
ncbi:MAG: BlaI/MecI/CopY family transcriptional regulator [Candidatus Gastranaerophilales bacterium]|nr:BlaI/MecI/CopY family transcriptional regulator [Candidatus Gastranaerophilales bacterium]